MKRSAILIPLLLIILTIFIGCGESTPAPTTDTTNDSTTNFKGFEIKASIETKRNYPITVKETDLSEQLESYIIKNVPAHKEDRYLTQLQPTVGALWIDFKKKKTKQYDAPFDDTYKYVSNILVSPTGQYLAMSLTKAEKSPWSKLIIIDTEKNTYEEPFDDNSLTEISEDSPCKKITIVESRTEENRLNECVRTIPRSPYVIDYWSNDTTVELLKAQEGTTISYSLDVS